MIINSFFPLSQEFIHLGGGFLVVVIELGAFTILGMAIIDFIKKAIIK